MMRSGDWRRLLVSAACAFVWCSLLEPPQARAEAPATTLASDGEAKLPIAVAEDASAGVREAAETLAAYLERMSGASFEVVARESPASGIVVGTADDFEALPFEVDLPGGSLGREDYVLRSEPGALWLIGATELAVNHAVWDVLHRLGHRQYFPGETWEIVPKRDTLALAVNAVERPDFHSRRIWYNWGLWGYNNEPYREWTARNRVIQGFDLNTGHVYGALYRANREAFEENPDYFALIDGERAYRGGNTKFCIGNEGLRALIVEHAVNRVRDDPALDSLSMDPSDGGGWCEADCEPCAEIGSGSVSDRALTLANEVAEAINELDKGEKHVGLLAYNRHAPPPTIEVHPNVIITATTHFVRDGYTLDQIIDGWAERGATLGIYDYFSVIAWDWNLPRLPTGETGKLVRPHALAREIPRYHERGARYFSAESGDAWGPYGLSYYLAGRMLWDVGEAARVDELIEEFLDNSFGPAREPMARFYELMSIEKGRRPLADVLARMYRALAEARELAAHQPAVLERLDDLALYTRYVELYKDYLDATGEAKDDALDEVLAHAYRMRETMMVHVLGLWRRQADNVGAADHPLKDDRPFTDEQIARIVREGRERHAPLDRPTFERISYSENLVPAAERLALAHTGERGVHPEAASDLQNYFVWLGPADAKPSGASRDTSDGSATAHEQPHNLELAVTVNERWNKRPHDIRLLPPESAAFADIDENDLIYCKFGCCAMAMHHEQAPVDRSGIVQPDGRTYDVKLATPHDGLHRLEVIDGGDFTKIDWPEDVRVTVPSGERTPGVTTHFRGRWSLYFYVLEGTETVGGWASRVGFHAPAEPGVVRDGDGAIVYDFADHEDGYFAIDVPEGQDGRLWQFDDNRGKRLLMTVPPYLARSARDLLLPAEVVDRDAHDAN